MPIAEIFTAANLINACVSGLIGNRVDGGFMAAAMQCARQFGGGNMPQNHHVLNAMHGAFTDSITMMARAADSAGGSAADNFSRRALQKFARSSELRDLKLDDAKLPVETLEERVRAIYGRQEVAPKAAAAELVIDLVEQAMGEPLTEPLREVFRNGHGRFTGWADTFELYFAAEVKKNVEVYRILTLDRLNELVALASEQAHHLDQLSDDVAEFRAETRAAFAEQKAAFERIEAALGRGEVAPGEAIDIIERAAREDRLSTEQRTHLSEIYGQYLRDTTEIPAPLIASAQRELAVANDPDLLTAALRNLAGEQRKALIEETEQRIDSEIVHAAARYRRLASFAALESLQSGMRLYRKAVDLDPSDVWAWIELSRLCEAAGQRSDSKRYLASAQQHATTDRQRAVIQCELGDIAVAFGDLAAAKAHYLSYAEVFKRLAAQEPGNAGWQHDLSVSHEKLGDVAVSAGDLGEARRCHAAALAISERLAGQEPGNAEWQRDLSVSHDRLGDVAVSAGDLGEARRHYEASLAISERLTAQEPGNAEWQRDLSVSHNKLGDVAVAAGDLAEARRRFAAGLAISERLAAQEPGNAGWQRDLFVSKVKLGNVAVAAGDLAEARRRYTAGLAISERLAAQEPGNAEWQRDLFVSNAKLAQLAETDRDPAGAIVRFSAAERVMVALVDRWPDHPGFARDLAQVQADLARLRG
ncbi:hypothetical protein U1839_01285 [Sphingomonas sp. RT2P30]|uniref:tetratricopeptide repeat protein n=1 Tax=Parasphingomonas halimpatiens TaxID=3096162 RepID=UPI002FCA59C0